MTTTDADLRALAHILTRLRSEAGLPVWAEHGARAVMVDLRHLPLDDLARRVVGHGLDPEARTPGALKRPFTPTPVADASPRHPKRGEGCEVCGRWPHQCTCPDGPQRPRPPTPPPPALLAETRQQIRSNRSDPRKQRGSSHSEET